MGLVTACNISMAEMDQVPIDGGIILKLGERSGRIKPRNFHIERKNDVSGIVYKTQRLMAKPADVSLELNKNFFVKPVRLAQETEISLVTVFAQENTVFSDLEAKRCFDIDFFEPDFPPAVGPTFVRSITVFATPDSAIADLWSYMSSLMIDQGVFAPSPEDPDQFVVVSVGERRRSTPASPARTAIIPIPSPSPPKAAKLSMIDAEILLSSLPLPPTSEYVDVSHELSEMGYHDEQTANYMQ